MSGPVEQQLRDYFADLDTLQGSVDITAITAADHVVDAPTVESIESVRSRRIPRRRALVLVAAAAVVVAVCVALLIDVNGEPRTVDVGPAEPRPGTAGELPSVLRMTCPTEGSRPTLESRRVALQADGLHIEVAPYRGDPLHIFVRGNYYFSHADLGYTQRVAVSSFVVPADVLTDLEPSAIELAVACGYSEPFGAPDQFYRGFAVEDPDDVWSSSTGGCRGHAIESDTVNVPDNLVFDRFDRLLASDRIAPFLRARTPGIRESDAFEPAEGGFSVLRGGESVARWHLSDLESAVLVTCPGSGIGTMG